MNSASETSDKQQQEPFNIASAQPAIQLIYSTGAQSTVSYHLNQDGLRLLKQFSQDESFEIISLIGQARKGKSFTLNNIIQQITGVPSFNADIYPFYSARSMKPVTYGIWMYIVPKCDNNEQYDDIQVDVNGDIMTRQYLLSYQL